MKFYRNSSFALLLLFQATIIGCKNNPETSETLSVASSQTDTISSFVTPETEESKEDKVMPEETDSNTCFDKSTYQLPFKGKIDYKNVKYSKLTCEISGMQKFSCGEKEVRYIALPDYKKAKVILVPQDCGDFEYRYYLLTIFENMVISAQYVEGIWEEPDDNSYKEQTSFTIDSDYTISVKTVSIENGKTAEKETLTFSLSDEGVLRKK